MLTAPLFNQAVLRPDIAILELENPFTINDYVKPACLPTEDIEPNSKCYTSGWGADVTVNPITMG